MLAESKRSASRCLAAVAMVLIAAGGAAAPAGSASAQGGDLPAPATSLSGDGRTASDGVRSLSVSKVAGLAPGGESVTVQGSGYDTFKGVYVAFCVIPPTNQLPSPCGGGMDQTGATGASHWISSNAPGYGAGLATAYGPGGSFTVTMALTPTINAIDCRRVRCAIVTRNDHVRTGDRSQDIFVPLSFATDAAPPVTAAPGQPSQPVDPGATPQPGQPVEPGSPATVPPTTAAPTTVGPTTTIPPAAPDADLPAPKGKLAANGLSVGFGSTGLVVSKATGLDADADSVTVTGFGFDLARGIEVALCAVDDAGEAGPCLGSTTARSLTAADDEPQSLWITSHPPARRDREPMSYGPGGAFSGDLAVRAVIDDDTDCREVACAIVTRSDASRPSDHSQDLAVPVTFVDDRPPTTTTDPSPDEGDSVEESASPVAAAAGTDGGGSTDGGGGALPLVAGAIAVALAGAGIALALRRRAVST